MSDLNAEKNKALVLMVRSLEGRAEGDPRKIADVIGRLANSDKVPLRLPK
jgi:hypothetical protein